MSSQDMAARATDSTSPPESPGGVTFDRTVWPYLVARTRGTVTSVEATQIIARLEPWLATRTSLLAVWVDGSEGLCPWAEDSAIQQMAAWLTAHRAEIRERRVAVAIVSPHMWKRREIEPQICWFEIVHGISFDVFAQERDARAWLRARRTRRIRGTGLTTRG